jgi:hypothetical protein
MFLLFIVVYCCCSWLLHVVTLQAQKHQSLVKQKKRK